MQEVQTLPRHRFSPETRSTANSLQPPGLSSSSEGEPSGTFLYLPVQEDSTAQEDQGDDTTDGSMNPSAGLVIGLSAAASSAVVAFAATIFVLWRWGKKRRRGENASCNSSKQESSNTHAHASAMQTANCPIPSSRFTHSVQASTTHAADASTEGVQSTHLPVTSAWVANHGSNQSGTELMHESDACKPLDDESSALPTPQHCSRADNSLNGYAILPQHFENTMQGCLTYSSTEEFATTVGGGDAGFTTFPTKTAEKSSERGLLWRGGSDTGVGRKQWPLPATAAGACINYHCCLSLQLCVPRAFASLRCL